MLQQARAALEEDSEGDPEVGMIEVVSEEDLGEVIAVALVVEEVVLDTRVEVGSVEEVGMAAVLLIIMVPHHRMHHLDLEGEVAMVAGTEAPRLMATGMDREVGIAETDVMTTTTDLGIAAAAASAEVIENLDDRDRGRHDDNDRKRPYDGGGYEDPRKLRRY
ncbi:uncharacterized protein KY384_004878 [Bacidia gigantensis]|uniref:uncharacterized protein n=1 Tax=Bacidia gigantensis TaxID=2732470 RepID=UPI001D04C68D|nr:uncharacterized protein KY384_004878 [Bacidia gigantensis]KAG8530376.1 hypothetical protein KY384_004878 [Bacidia gigantensis]